MVGALAVAEGTRRSNMSRLRSWLGTSPDGEAYLPDAYTGRITLHPAVSSDWQRLQILTSAGVNRASDESLHTALELVRGAPLADAAPGQWHWAEELRTDMISCVRDIGLELADRALVVGNLEQARWAASRALLAAPGDELLLAARIRTEHAAGTQRRPNASRFSLRPRHGCSASTSMTTQSRCCSESWKVTCERAWRKELCTRHDDGAVRFADCRSSRPWLVG